MKGYPKWFSVSFVTLIMSLLMITGDLLIPTTLELRLQWQMPWRLSADHRILVAAAHAIMALIVFSLMGALWSLHMRQEWRREKSRWSGASMVGSIILLGLTGVGVYYFGNEKLAYFSGLSHLVLGLLVSGIYFVHVFFLTQD